MNHFDELYEIAADNYGVVTYADAREIGVVGTELSRWTASGRLAKLGHGVYRLVRWVPTGYEHYAEALALVGPGSVLWGESVLALLGLAYVNPRTLYVATPKRVRKKLPPWVCVSQKPVLKVEHYQGIACQELAEALLACRGRVLAERLRNAVNKAREEGLISKERYEYVRQGLS